ncbi:MAG: DUF1858 domain-containing protein [Boseongicola sp.]|nr:DUF1858 domain-containing protein [Boseongicola sp.]
MPVGKIMNEWPNTISVFIDFKMLCVGCPFAPFHSLKVACDLHPVEWSDISESMRGCVTDETLTRAPSTSEAE